MSDEKKNGIGNEFASKDMMDLADGIGEETVAKPGQQQTSTPAAKEATPADGGEISLPGADELAGDGTPAGESGSEKPIEEQFPEPQGLEKNASEAFKQMRTRIAELTEAVKKTPSADPSEVETLKKQLDEYRGRLDASEIARTPEFVGKYVAPIKQTVAKITELCKQHKIDPTKIREIVRMKPSERDTALDRLNLSPTATARIVTTIDTLAEQSQAHRKALSDLQKTGEDLKRDRQQNLVTLQTTVLNKAVERLKTDNHFLLSIDPAKNPKWNDSIMSQAKRIIAGGLKPDELAEVALRASLADHYKKLYLRDVLDARRKNQQNTGKTGSTKPGLSAGSTAKPPSGKEKLPATVEELANTL